MTSCTFFVFNDFSCYNCELTNYIIKKYLEDTNNVFTTFAQIHEVNVVKKKPNFKVSEDDLIKLKNY